MRLDRGSMFLTMALSVAVTTACPGNGGKKNKDAAPALDIAQPKKDLNASNEAGAKDLAVDIKPDQTVKVDLPAPKDLHPSSGEWMPCYGLSGYDNTCVNYKTSQACCRDTFSSSANACPPGLICGHYDCLNMPDMGINSKPCPVTSYCISPLRCRCTKSKGWCGACDNCSTSCNLLAKCPTKP